MEERHPVQLHLDEIKLSPSKAGLGEVLVEVWRKCYIKTVAMLSMGKTTAEVRDLDEEFSPWLQYPVHFFHDIERLVEMLDHMKGFNCVECIISERIWYDIQVMDNVGLHRCLPIDIYISLLFIFTATEI